MAHKKQSMKDDRLINKQTLSSIIRQKGEFKMYDSGIIISVCHNKGAIAYLRNDVIQIVCSYRPCDNFVEFKIDTGVKKS